jgi:L-aspartate oxidase
LRADFVVIGSGIAALRACAALEGAGDVIVLTKADPLEGNTGYAQGGIAAAVGPGDSPERHFADTLAAGDGLCDERAVRVLVEDGPRYVRELIEWGAAFDRAADGSLELGLEAAHSMRRVLHVRDATGRDIGHTLWTHVARIPNVRVLASARAVALLTREGRCVGARFASGGATTSVEARCTLLATGGAGQVFSETTNPPVATGDGIAFAYRAGAAVADLEFVQFHPTALKVPGQPRFLLSEALRGEGAWLVNEAGERFMERYESAGDLAPRDRVARAIVREGRRTGGRIYLTLAHLDSGYVRQRFPQISEACRRVGLDLARDRIPVGPAAHYMMGGVVTDVDGRTTMSGLFAAGEVACTGVHGANRLASNSLLEGLVFGARAGVAMRNRPDDPIDARTVEGFVPSVGQEGVSNVNVGVTADQAALLAWEHAGLFRTKDGLLQLLDKLGRPDADEGTSITVARLVGTAALRREESRGGHYRLDFPERDDRRWRHRVLQRIV